jgi:signal peptidase II
LKKSAFVILLIAFSACLIGLDQLAKFAADTGLKGAGVVRLVGDLVVLVYAQNTGAFLSMGSQLGETGRIALLIVLPVAVLTAFAVIYLRKKKLARRDLALLSLLMGGGLGNIVDRIFRGQVTDFLLFQLTPKIRTGVMNLADLYILGVVILVLVEALGKRKPDESAAKEPGRA